MRSLITVRDGETRFNLIHHFEDGSRTGERDKTGRDSANIWNILRAPTRSKRGHVTFVHPGRMRGFIPHVSPRVDRKESVGDGLNDEKWIGTSCSARIVAFSSEKKDRSCTCASGLLEISGKRESREKPRSRSLSFPTRRYKLRTQIHRMNVRL